MDISLKETRFLFLAPAIDNAMERHLLDLLYGILILLLKGVNSNNIYLFTENISDEKLDYLINTMTLQRSFFNIKEIKEYYNFIKKDDMENCVVFISSHGNPDGICTNENLKPFTFISNFNLTKYKNIVIYFGQCYSGIYNFLPLDKCVDLEKKNIVLAGATGFYPSLSLPVTVTIDSNCINWNSNTFLYNLFNWFYNFIDIDDDKKFSVMDSFKYSATYADSRIQDFKLKEFYTASKKIILFYQKRYFIKRIISKILKKDNKLEKEAKESILYSQLVHEPWILNAIKANDLYYI